MIWILDSSTHMLLILTNDTKRWCYWVGMRSSEWRVSVVIETLERCSHLCRIWSGDISLDCLSPALCRHRVCWWLELRLLPPEVWETVISCIWSTYLPYAFCCSNSGCMRDSIGMETIPDTKSMFLQPGCLCCTRMSYAETRQEAEVLKEAGRREKEPFLRWDI